MNRHCFNCGESVGDGDWDAIGHQRVFVCGETACQNELATANRQVQDEAAYEAMRDGYERYWS